MINVHRVPKAGGETGKADALYREWLNADPQWGWGWIGWSDCYRFTRTKLKDLHKAEELLQQGFSITGVRDFQYLAERLADLYQEQRRVDEARQIQQQAQMYPPEIKTSFEILPDGKVRRRRPNVIPSNEGLLLGELPKRAPLPPTSSAQLTGGRHKIGRNQPCLCGSGRKFKKCCG